MVRADEQNIEWRMIGLPNGIQPSRFAPDEPCRMLRCRRSCLCWAKVRRLSSQPADEAIYTPVAGELLSEVLSEALHLAVQRDDLAIN